MVIKEKDYLIETLNIELKELRTRPTIINNIDNSINNTINIDKYIQSNFTPITMELLTDDIDNLTLMYVLGGGEGLAKFIVTHPFKNNDKLMCVDYSRRIGKYINDEEQLTKDPELKTLTINIFGAYVNQAEMLIDSHIDCTNFDLSDEFEFKEHLDLINLKGNYQKESRGVLTSLRASFLKSLCTNTLRDNFNFMVIS